MKVRNKHGPLAAMFVALAATAPLAPASAQQSGLEALDEESFGDIFVHPRDRFYLPGQAPSRATLNSTTTIEDSRGQVSRYEYNKGNTVISRETWQDERGESQARIGIGRKF